MPKRVQLPPGLTGRPFTVAEAAAAGVSKGRTRGSDLARPFHGVRAPRDTTTPAPAGPPPLDTRAREVISRCRSFAPRLRPGQFFSHASAAVLWRVPVPERLLRSDHVHVTSVAPQRAIEVRGTMGHQVQVAPTIAWRLGLPVTDAASMFCELAASVGTRLITLDDLVAIGDHLVLDPEVLDPRDLRPYVALADLNTRVSVFTGRGARAAASAVRLVRAGSESRRETLLRLLLGRAGLPEPELNPVILDATGRRIGRADLVYRAWSVLVEYDGDQHRTDSVQYNKDMWRLEQFIAAGWTVVRVRKRGLFGAPEETVARVRAALTLHGWTG